MTNPNPAAPLTRDPYRDEREHERQSNAGSHLFDSACYFCLRDFWMQHEEDAARATSTPVGLRDGWEVVHRCGGEPRALLRSGIEHRCPVCRWTVALSPLHPNTMRRPTDD